VPVGSVPIARSSSIAAFFCCATRWYAGCPTTWPDAGMRRWSTRRGRLFCALERSGLRRDLEARMRKRTDSQQRRRASWKRKRRRNQRCSKLLSVKTYEAVASRARRMRAALGSRLTHDRGCALVGANRRRREATARRVAVKGSLAPGAAVTGTMNGEDLAAITSVGRSAIPGCPRAHARRSLRDTPRLSGILCVPYQLEPVDVHIEYVETIATLDYQRFASAVARRSDCTG